MMSFNLSTQHQLGLNTSSDGFEGRTDPSNHVEYIAYHVFNAHSRMYELVRAGASPCANLENLADVDWICTSARRESKSAARATTLHIFDDAVGWRFTTTSQRNTPPPLHIDHPRSRRSCIDPHSTPAPRSDTIMTAARVTFAVVLCESLSQPLRSDRPLSIHLCTRVIASPNPS